MIRYSWSTSFTPSDKGPGYFMFYLTINRWEDDKCVNSKTIFDQECRMIPEADDDTSKLDWATDLADIAWNILVAARSAKHVQPVRGSNPLWPDTTGKPMDM